MLKKVVSLLLTLSFVFVIMSMEHSGIYQQSLVFGQTLTEGPSIESGTNDTQGQVDSFDAEGTIGSLAVDTLVGSDTSLGTHTGDLWILGGNWSFSVENGNLSNFDADIVMTRQDGSGRHIHSIDTLTDATGAIPPLTESNIVLRSENYTAFMGNANITTGEQVRYQDVPLVIHLNNGNALNLNVDPVKTDHHFKGLPVLGTVFSITDESGNQLRNEG